MLIIFFGIGGIWNFKPSYCYLKGWWYDPLLVWSIPVGTSVPFFFFLFSLKCNRDALTRNWAPQEGDGCHVTVRKFTGKTSAFLDKKRIKIFQWFANIISAQRTIKMVRRYLDIKFNLKKRLPLNSLSNLICH